MPTYQEKQDWLRERWRTLLGEYVGRELDGSWSKPFAIRDTCSPALSSELEMVERQMLEHPPLDNYTGKPKKKGLLLPQDSPVSLPRGKIPKAIDSDDFVTLATSKWADYIEGTEPVNLRQYNEGMILDQNGYGSCAGSSCAGGVMCIRHFTGMERIKLSPIFTYHWSSDGRDGGSTLYDNVLLAQEKGEPTEELWPASKGFRANPPDEVMADALKHRLGKVVSCDDWEQMGSALLFGRPVHFGYGGHAVLAIQAVSTSRVLYLNSWGDWGDGGYGTLASRSIVTGYGMYAYLSAVQDPFGGPAREASLSTAV